MTIARSAVLSVLLLVVSVTAVGVAAQQPAGDAAGAAKPPAAADTPLFVRFTNRSTEQQPFAWWVFVYHAQATAAPTFANAGMLTPDGFTELYVFPPEPEKQLHVGQTTAWAQLTKYMRSAQGQPPGLDSMQLIATRGTHVSGFVAGRIRGTFEFGVGPDKRVVKTIEVDQAGPRLWLSLTHDVQKAEDIRTAFDFVRESRAALDKLGPLKGRPATHMDVATGLNLEAGVDDPKLIEAELDVLKRMGFNNVFEPIAPAAEAQAFNAAHGLAPRFGLTLHLFHNQGSGDHCTVEPLLQPDKAEAMMKALAEKYAPVMDRVTRLIIADEPAGMLPEHMIRHEPDRKQFAADLKAQGLSPANLGVGSWEEVVPVLPADRAKHPRLWYHTTMFNVRALDSLVKRSVALKRKYFPDHVRTCVNYVPPLGYGDWTAMGVDPFLHQRDGGLELGWQEDWRAAGVSTQHVSDTLAMLRAAGRYEQPLGSYMVAVDSPPQILRLKYYGLLAGGARQFNVYNYGPAYASVDVWGGQHDIYPAIAAVQHEIGAIDEALHGTVRRRADVAILYNRTASVWAAAERKLTTQLDGRFARWALNHAGYDAEYVPEEDVEAGGLARYKVLYLTGPQLRPAAAGKIAEWVRAGGTVFATAGAGTRDEYNQPMGVLDEVFGARSGEFKVEQEVGATPKYEIGFLPSLDALTTQGEGTPTVTFDRLAIRETLTPAAGAAVILQDAAGRPAGVRHPFGKGTAIRIAALPGMAYIAEALKDFKPNGGDQHVLNYLPSQFRPELRDFLTWPAELAGAARIARSNVAAGEIVRYDGDGQTVVFVIDHSGASTPRFSMTLPDAGQFTRAYSATGKPVALKASPDGVLEVSLPLDGADAVVLEK